MLLAMSLILASRTHAESQDTVTLTSGSRMVGEIEELSRARLAFSIDGAGTVDIRWDNIETLQSMRRLNAEVTSGQRFLGTIASPSAGKLVWRSTVASTMTSKSIATFRERITRSRCWLGWSGIGSSSEGART